MKANKIMRVASVLLVAVLLTTCAISSTFAKYVTTASGSDTARVAKWGVSITVPGTMFSDSYKDTATTYTANETGDTITVQADTQGTKILAPGTNGTLANLAVTGTPEVDVTVTYTADLVLTNWKIGENEYCPIVFTVAGNTIQMGGEINTVAKLETAVENAIAAVTNTYNTNTNLSTVVNDDLVVTWAWAYSGNDVNDTALGNAAAAGNAATISLTVNATITQVD